MDISRVHIMVHLVDPHYMLHQWSEAMFITTNFLLMVSLGLSFGLLNLRNPSLSWELWICLDRLLPSNLIKWPVHLSWYIAQAREFKFRQDKTIWDMLRLLGMKNFALVTHHIDIKSLCICFEYLRNTWGLRELWCNTLCIQFYGEVFVEVDLLL